MTKAPKLDAADQQNAEGCKLMERGDYAGAVDCFRRSVTLSRVPPYAEASNLFHALLRSARVDEAKVVFDTHLSSEVGRSDDAACKLAGLLAACGMPRAAAKVCMSVLRAPAAYSDDRTRGELGLIVATLLALGSANMPSLKNALEEARGLLKGKMGRRQQLLERVLDPSFWHSRETEELADLREDHAWEWKAVQAVRSFLDGPSADRSAAEAVISEPWKWVKPLTPILQHYPVAEREESNSTAKGTRRSKSRPR